MAHPMLKLYGFLMYFLAIVAFFFVGVTYAGIVEAGKGQMLAGGAIVLGYGVMGSFLGLCLALFLAYSLKRKTIIRINIILLVSIISFWAYYHIKYLERQKEKQEQNRREMEQRKKTSPAASDAVPTKYSSLDEMVSFANINSPKQVDTFMGLGMFSPNIVEGEPLYFYGNINQEKPLDEHLPYDSITFKRDEYNNIAIATAPPWLNPEHLKLDYGIFIFKVKTVFREFVEIEVNRANGQTSFVSLYDGNISYWPEFILKVHSVEFLDAETQKVKIKPLDHASEVIADFSIMQPVAVRQDWLMVALMDSNYKKVGEGWVKWRMNGQLLLRYSLLS